MVKFLTNLDRWLLTFFVFLLLASSNYQNNTSASISCDGVDSSGNSAGTYNHLTSDSPSATPLIVGATIFCVILLIICAASFDCCKHVCSCIHDPFWACLKAYAASGDDEAVGTKRLIAIIYFLLTGAIGVGLWHAYEQSGATQGTWVGKDMVLCWKGVHTYCSDCGAPYRPEVVVRYYDHLNQILTVHTCPKLPCDLERSSDDALKYLQVYSIGKVYSGLVTKEDESVAYLDIESTNTLKILAAIFFLLFGLLGVGLFFSYLCGCLERKHYVRNSAYDAFS